MNRKKSIVNVVTAATILCTSIMTFSPPLTAQAAQLPARVDNSELPCFPPIIDQGNTGACQSMCTTYYQMTHMFGLKRNLDAKNNPSNIFSPKWVHNFLNRGVPATGNKFSNVLPLLSNHGAPSLTQVPFSDTLESSKPWHLDGEAWKTAIFNRIDYGTVNIGGEGIQTPVKSVNDLTSLKQYLADGYVLSFGCAGLGGWEFKTISDDPYTTADNNSVTLGKSIAYALSNTGMSGHAMTVVGYDDNVWTDINGNGNVDQSEKGALRIANSWGENQSSHGGFQHGDGGFIWLAYDALNKVSALDANPYVDNAPYVEDRVFAFDGNGSESFNKLYWMTPKEDYSPKLIGKFTINHCSRDEIIVSLGYSNTNVTDPDAQMPLTILSKDIKIYASPRSFDGTYNNFMDGTFYFDYSSLIDKYNLGDGTKKRWYLIVEDNNKNGNSTVVKNFQLLDSQLKVIKDTGNIARSVDGGVMSNSIYLDATVKVCPKDLKATYEGQKINLSWAPVSNAAGYQISINNGTFFSVGAKPAYTYTVSAKNAVYSFKIRAIDSQNAVMGVVSQSKYVRAILNGDVNGDQTINSTDATLVQNHVLNNQTLSAIQKIAADVDGNGLVQSTDYSYISKYASGIINKFPKGAVTLTNY